MLLGLPMQEESGATGRVAAVYADIRRKMVIVPSPFKSLAINPGYLQLAWLQIRHAYDALDSGASRLSDAVDAEMDRRSLPPVPNRTAAQALESVGLLVPRMLMTVEFLGGLLEGRLIECEIPSSAVLEGSDHPSGSAPESRMVLPGSGTSAVEAVYTDIQQTYGVPFVSSMYRVLAAEGLLRETWMAAKEFQSGPDGRSLANWISGCARDVISDLLPRGFAGPKGLAAVGELDALESIRQLLAIYRHGIPQVLTFVRWVATGGSADG